MYAIQLVNFTSGKTYKIDYDIRMAGVGTELMYDPSDSASTLCNFQFVDAAGSNHVVDNSNGAITGSNGWVHVSRTYTVPSYLTDHSGDRFTIFSNPTNGKAINFYLDNVVVVELDD